MNPFCGLEEEACEPVFQASAHPDSPWGSDGRMVLHLWV